MNTDQRAHRNFTIHNADEITVFDMRGIRLSDDTWEIAGIRVNPSNALSEVQELVKHTFDAGMGAFFHIVVLRPVEAICLYLEGVLKAEHLDLASEDIDSIELPFTTAIPGAGLVRIRILKDPAFRIATANISTKVLYAVSSEGIFTPSSGGFN